MKEIEIETTKVAKILGIAVVSVLATFALLATVNSFFQSYYFSFQTPVIFQSPILIHEREIELKSPVVEESEAIELPAPTQAPQPTPAQSWTGTASWYSREGCIGCNPDRIMANGEPLDDDALTVAFNKVPLGSMVRIRNLENNMITEAEVTDTGGFESLGRIVDLTPRVRRQINCSDLCEVEVTLIEE